MIYKNTKADKDSDFFDMVVGGKETMFFKRQWM